MEAQIINYNLVAEITDFIKSIGIDIINCSFEDKTFLPGIKIEYGKIIVDEEKLLYPGDLLHEAGHLAVKPKKERENLYIDMGNDPAEEMMAIAWSYAALVYLNIPPEVVFHEDGYKGSSKIIIDNLTGTTGAIGVPMLQWCGMTLESKRASEEGKEPFPKMIKWLRC